MSAPRPRILFFQHRDAAYTHSLCDALISAGLAVLPAEFAGRWLHIHAQRGDIGLLHWPSFLYARPGNKAVQVLWFLRFAILLLLMRVRGVRIIWIAHNLMPHDRTSVPGLDVAARHWVLLLSHRVLAHGPCAARHLVQRFPSAARKLELIPHGHWIDRYPQTLDAQQARQQLGLAKTEHVLLFIGACKSYKQLHLLVEEFRRTSVSDRLLVAGKFQDPVYEQHIRELAEGDPRVMLRTGFIDDDQLQVYLKSCDVVVVPYREILTSGTAMLAMSFGRPVVSIRAGFLEDVISEDAGLLYSVEDPEGLTRALQAIRQRRFDEARIKQHAHSYTFEDAARVLGRLLH